MLRRDELFQYVALAGHHQRIVGPGAPRHAVQMHKFLDEFIAAVHCAAILLQKFGMVRRIQHGCAIGHTHTPSKHRSFKIVSMAFDLGGQDIEAFGCERKY